MPYVNKDKREELNKVVSLMEELGIKADGDLNYILFKFARTLKPSYNGYKNYCGELRQCATEIERRMLGPYEEEKIKENGDVK